MELEKVTLPADDTAVSGAAVSGVTIDAGHDTAAERLAVDTDHCMTITLDDPAWIDDGEFYFLKLVVDAAAGTVFTFFGARANYTLRVNRNSFQKGLPPFFFSPCEAPPLPSWGRGQEEKMIFSL